MTIDGMMEGEGVLDYRLHLQGPGVGGVRIGDAVAVTAEGRDVLTPAPYYRPR
jgi:Xaa-Pro aminopeptidase